MKELEFNLKVGVPDGVDAETVRQVLDNLVKAGLGDAQSTLNHGEGDLEGAQLAVDMILHSPTLVVTESEEILDEAEITEFLDDRIENGAIELELITASMTRYGLMTPDAFRAEMAAQMREVEFGRFNPDRNEGVDEAPCP